MPKPPLDVAPWRAWLDHVCGALDVDARLVDPHLVHALTSEVAERWTRAMAPVSAALWGMAGVTDDARAQVVAAAQTAVAVPGGEQDPAAWARFVDDACARLGLDRRLVDELAILDLTRQVAHAGARPVAPVAAFVWGVAMTSGGGAGDDGGDATPEVVMERLRSAVASAPTPATV
ncbi:DUF6457 domain-containing protein [Propionibacteriaceae bacterium G1746]